MAEKPEITTPTSTIIRGMLVMAVAIGLAPINDSTAKYLAQDYHVLQVVWARFFFQAALMVLAFGPRRLAKLFRTGNLKLQLLRGCLTVTGTICLITALSFIPLVDAIAVLFSAPFFIVVLSIPILGERVGIHRWTAVFVGFAAVLVVMRPGLGVMHWAAVFALFAALTAALFQIVTRVLTRTDPALTTLLYMAVFGTVVLAAPAAAVWTPPSLEAWALMATMGLLAGLSHFGQIKSIEMAPVSALAPFHYTQIITASLLGYLIFSDLPDAFTIGGVAIIIGAGLYVFHRERRAAAHDARSGQARDLG